MRRGLSSHCSKAMRAPTLCIEGIQPYCLSQQSFPSLEKPCNAYAKGKQTYLPAHVVLVHLLECVLFSGARDWMQ